MHQIIKSVILFFYLIGFIIVCAFAQKEKNLTVGLWEPYLDSNISFVNKYKNPNEIKDNKDNDGNNIVDDINGAFFNNEGKMVGLPNKLNDDVSAENKEHGYAVTSILTKGLDNITICQVGFMPTTMRLTATGILILNIEDRIKHLPLEINYNDEFVQQSIAYFKEKKVKIVNMSFGNSASIFLENNTNLGNTPEVAKENAFKWMQRFKNSFIKGFETAPEILFIVAAGNDGELMDSVLDTPASAGLSNVLCVGALNRLGKIASFSNFGKEVDVYASGEGIPIKMPDGKVQYLDGTSLSVPLVTNVAIKLLQQNLLLSGANLKIALLKELKKKRYKNNFLVVDR